ncbi:MAG: hypothetical protein ACRC78_11745 [Planktothrix sp.]
MRALILVLNSTNFRLDIDREETVPFPACRLRENPLTSGFLFDSQPRVINH